MLIRRTDDGPDAQGGKRGQLDVAGLTAKLLLHRPRFEPPHKDLYIAITEAADAITALERENAALREDRELLDWLNTQLQHGTDHMMTRITSLRIYTTGYHDIRAAIRAARGQR